MTSEEDSSITPPMISEEEEEEEEDNSITLSSDLKIDPRQLASLESKLAAEPKILSKNAGCGSCSIFRVPQDLIDVNGKHYHPHIVSIGPFHHGHGEPHLQMIQEHKYAYLSQLLARTQLTLLDLFNTIFPLEASARACYSEEIQLELHQFLEILVVDGCFILELFLKISHINEQYFRYQPYDPLVSMTWVFPFLRRDLLRLENQLPFFVLETLFRRTCLEEEGGRSLTDLCFMFFGYDKAVKRPEWVVSAMRGFQAKHLLDLLRSSFIPTIVSNQLRAEKHRRNHNHHFTYSSASVDLPIHEGYGWTGENATSHVIDCVSKLRRAGIKIRPPPKRGNNKAAQNTVGEPEPEPGLDTFLEVKYVSWGVIEMPTVIIDDFMTSFLANCVAYEICQQNCAPYFKTYTKLLDCLVNTSTDVEYLCDQNVIKNYLGSDEEAALYLNDLGKDVAIDIDQCYLAKLFFEVDQYYRNKWNVHWASFKYTYFNTPWSFVSAMAAFILLVLTVLQTTYTVLSYYFGAGS